MRLYLKLRPGETLQYHGPYHPEGVLLSKRLRMISADKLQISPYVFSMYTTLILRRGINGIYFQTNDRYGVDEVLRIVERSIDYINVPERSATIRVDMSHPMRNEEYVIALERLLRTRLLTEVNDDLRAKGHEIVLSASDLRTTFIRTEVGNHPDQADFTLISEARIYSKLQHFQMHSHRDRQPW